MQTLRRSRWKAAVLWVAVALVTVAGATAGSFVVDTRAAASTQTAAQPRISYSVLDSAGDVSGFGANGLRMQTTPQLEGGMTFDAASIASTPDGMGDWVASTSGLVATIGDATFEGSLGDVRLAAPVVGMASTGTGHGYWLVASDGGVFAFGDARFAGSLGDVRLAAPVVGMASSGTGHGYWLVASDGGVFAFGDARFAGSLADVRLAAPAIGIASTGTALGYWIVGADGGVFGFGDAPFDGSLAPAPVDTPVIATSAAR